MGGLEGNAAGQMQLRPIGKLGTELAPPLTSPTARLRYHENFEPHATGPPCPNGVGRSVRGWLVGAGRWVDGLMGG